MHKAIRNLSWMIPRFGASLAFAVALLAGCAPDAFRRDPAFEAWLREVRTACQDARIGTTTVGRLLGSTGSEQGNQFLNQTSRLYAGLITPAQWTSGVTAFGSGGARDPGLQCVLERLPEGSSASPAP
jgi:hypothetical protein